MASSDVNGPKHIVDPFEILSLGPHSETVLSEPHVLSEEKLNMLC